MSVQNLSNYYQQFLDCKIIDYKIVDNKVLVNVNDIDDFKEY